MSRSKICWRRAFIPQRSRRRASERRNSICTAETVLLTATRSSPLHGRQLCPPRTALPYPPFCVCSLVVGCFSPPSPALSRGGPCAATHEPTPLAARLPLPPPHPPAYSPGPLRPFAPNVFALPLILRPEAPGIAGALQRTPLFSRAVGRPFPLAPKQNKTLFSLARWRPLPPRLPSSLAPPLPTAFTSLPQRPCFHTAAGEGGRLLSGRRRCVCVFSARVCCRRPLLSTPPVAPLPCALSSCLCRGAAGA